MYPVQAVKNVRSLKEDTKMDLIQSITEEYKKTDIPDFNIGDTVRVSIKVREGNKERIQVFE